VQPSAELSNARAAAQELDQLLTADVEVPAGEEMQFDERIHDAASRLSQHFQALDHWLSRGGSFPPAWAGMCRDPQDPEEVLDDLEGGA
jgi:hypothetical protein